MAFIPGLPPPPSFGPSPAPDVAGPPFILLPFSDQDRELFQEVGLLGPFARVRNGVRLSAELEHGLLEAFTRRYGGVAGARAALTGGKVVAWGGYVFAVIAGVSPTSLTLNVVTTVAALPYVLAEAVRAIPPLRDGLVALAEFARSNPLDALEGIGAAIPDTFGIRGFEVFGQRRDAATGQLLTPRPPLQNPARGRFLLSQLAPPIAPIPEIPPLTPSSVRADLLAREVGFLGRASAGASLSRGLGAAQVAANVDRLATAASTLAQREFITALLREGTRTLSEAAASAATATARTVAVVSRTPIPIPGIVTRSAGFVGSAFRTLGPIGEAFGVADITADLLQRIAAQGEAQSLLSTDRRVAELQQAIFAARQQSTEDATLRTLRYFWGQPAEVPVPGLALSEGRDLRTPVELRELLERVTDEIIRLQQRNPLLER